MYNVYTYIYIYIYVFADADLLVGRAPASICGRGAFQWTCHRDACADNSNNNNNNNNS